MSQTIQKRALNPDRMRPADHATRAIARSLHAFDDMAQLHGLMAGRLHDHPGLPIETL